MPEKVDFSNYDKILENFDEFCSEFEDRAINGYISGDQNNGRVNGEVSRTGEGAQGAVREIAEPRAEDIAVRAPNTDVSQTYGN